MSLGDLNSKSEDSSFRKFRLRIDEIQGRTCLTNFHGMTITADKLRSMVKKWQSLIEAFIDVKTTDGYLLRVFTIAFTRRRPKQVSKTSYAQSSQIRAIRKRMFEVISREVSSCELKEVVAKLVSDSMSKEIEKVCHSIYPLQNVCIHKVKVIKMPKYDVQKLLELHAESESLNEDTGSRIERADESFVEPTPSDNI